MASEFIYRVTVKTTGSLQPGSDSNSYWNENVAYCGPSLRDARVAFLREEASDYGGSYGNRCRSTVIEAFDAEPDEIDDSDEVSGDLYDYNTNEYIREATLEEIQASAAAAKMDGGAGVILVNDDDEVVTADSRDSEYARRCYVQRD